MINLYKQDGETLYGIKEFIVDSAEEVQNLPTKKIGVGSTAIVISDGSIYIFNGSHKWVLFSHVGGSGGGNTPATGDNGGTLIEF